MQAAGRRVLACERDGDWRLETGSNPGYFLVVEECKKLEDSRVRRWSEGGLWLVIYPGCSLASCLPGAGETVFDVCYLRPGQMPDALG